MPRKNGGRFPLRGSIVRRKSKSGEWLYYCVVAIEGRQKWLKVPGAQTKRNAEAYRAEIIAEINRGDYYELPRCTFGEFWDRWFQTAKGELRPNTIRNYQEVLNLYVLPAFEGRQISKIGREEIERWKSELLSRLSPSTVAHAITKLKRIFKDALDWGYIKRNPLKGVSLPSIPRVEASFLDASQVRLALAAAPSLQWQTFLLTAITTGLRISELVAMRWAHLKWDEGKYFVAEQYYCRGADKGFKPPKTDYSRTDVQLTPQCVRYLRDHKTEQARHRLQHPGYTDLGLIFPRNKGTIYSPSHIRQEIWLPILKRAGLPPVRLHDLRHTCAALLIDQGESPKYIQQQLRHKNIQTTFNVYGHLFPERSREAAERLDLAIFGGKP